MKRMDLEEEEEKKKKKRRIGGGGRTPCCEKEITKKGTWSTEEDKLLIDYISKNGNGSWHSLPKLAGLQRCGKSCRLRWNNYLRPGINHGKFTEEEQCTIIQLHGMLGNKWAAIASRLVGRTDNDVKNVWNSHLKKRVTEGTRTQNSLQVSCLSRSDYTNSESTPSTHMVQWESVRLQAEARLSMDTLRVNPSSAVNLDCDYILRLWNSDVGDSFKNIDRYKASCLSPKSQLSSSSTKGGLGSGVTIQTDPPKMLTCSDAMIKQEPLIQELQYRPTLKRAYASSSEVTIQTDPPGGILLGTDGLKKQEPAVHTRLKKEPETYFCPNFSESFPLNDFSHTYMKLLLDDSRNHHMENSQDVSDAEEEEEEDVSIYLV